MPAINAAITAALLAGTALTAAGDQAPWTTTNVTEDWTTTVVATPGRAPRPATRTRRHHAPRTWRAATTCRPLDAGTWTVRRGDTLWLVGTCTGTTVRQVAEASGIDPTAVLRIGQVLHVPGDAR